MATGWLSRSQKKSGARRGELVRAAQYAGGSPYIRLLFALGCGERGFVASENPCPEFHTNPWNTPDFTVYGLWIEGPSRYRIGQKHLQDSG